MNRKVINIYGNIVMAVFVVMVIWWLFITVYSQQNTINNFLYGAALGILPLISSIFGFINAKKWGGLHSAMGKAVNFLSAGLFTWALGTLIFAYYNIFLNVEVPYPSLADAAYIISWPLWGMGMYYLSKATGAKYGLRSSTGKIIFLIIPIIVIVLSYYLLVVVARGGVLTESFDDYLKLFFDLAYPVGDVVILILATLIYGLSYNYFGGKFKSAIYLVLLGFVINYIADFSFSYTTTNETFYVANWVDLIFTTAMFTLSLGVSLFDPNTLDKEKN